MVMPNDTLLEVLRDQLDLTGSKESCDEGVCGSCTVHMDGKPVRSCLTLALEAKGSIQSGPSKGWQTGTSCPPFRRLLSTTVLSNAVSVRPGC